MRLYLVQHADAVLKDIDPNRPLSAKGQADAEAMAALLKAADIRVDGMVHSGKLRAVQTTEVLARAVWPGKSGSKMEGLKANDSTDLLCNTVMASKGDLMVVSHMPFVARAAARCLMGSEIGALVRFEPGSVMCLERKKEGGENHWSLEWFVRPGMLGARGG